jgi:hypothetical protein
MEKGISGQLFLVQRVSPEAGQVTVFDAVRDLPYREQMNRFVEVWRIMGVAADALSGAPQAENGADHDGEKGSPGLLLLFH